MTLGEVLDRLEELGDEPLCIGMSDREGGATRHCAAAHMLRIAGYKGNLLGTRCYGEFDRYFGFPTAEVYNEIDPITMRGGCTAARAAQHLRKVFEGKGWLSRATIIPHSRET